MQPALFRAQLIKPKPRAAEALPNGPEITKTAAEPTNSSIRTKAWLTRLEYRLIVAWSGTTLSRAGIARR
ncbi:MAG: hypothetical protein F7C35_02750 [Desulfurococcales archaeon]|nr:hypothetical protein [Desulfurococcales archaeon]